MKWHEDRYDPKPLTDIVLRTLEVSLVLCTSLLLPKFLSAQVWQKQTSGVTTTLYDVFFVDSLRGWAVGESGTIIGTVNGGSTWQPQASGTTAELRKVCFVDSLYGWAAGKMGIVLHTTNGGISWAKQTPEGWDYWDIHFVNRQVGHLVAGTQGSTMVYGAILRTTDGGLTWYSTIGQNVGGFQSVYFVSPDEGWVVGGKDLVDNFSADLILHTTNGGATWTEQPTPTMGPLFRVKFLDKKIGCSAGFSNNGQSILLTNDGGLTWKATNTPGGPQGVLSIAMIDSLTIWVLRYESVHQTQNGGGSWQKKGPDSALTMSLSFVGPRNGWIVGSFGSMWKYEIPTRVETILFKKPEYCLEQNYPNPFNSSTKISFAVPNDGDAILRVYDILGREVAKLVDEFKVAGNYFATFDAGSLPSGIYFSRLEFGGKSIVSKMMLLK
ncbi:MAG: YCF48-related protein [Bacteroidota bacterium]